MNRRTFQKLAIARLQDAKVLLKARRFDAAYYLAGYVIECALKACIAKRTKKFDFPPKSTNKIYTHDLEHLLESAGLAKAFEIRLAADATLARYWTVVKDWSEESRYDASGLRAAKELLEAVSDPSHGVLQCLQKDW
jgi:HEPN domain-containing protein